MKYFKPKPFLSLFAFGQFIDVTEKAEQEGPCGAVPDDTCAEAGETCDTCAEILKNLSTPLQAGDRVMVFNTPYGDPNGKPYEEGIATLVKQTSTEDHWMGRFETEPERTYLRFVQAENRRC